MPVGHFLVGVAALIYHPESNKYLLVKRSAHKDAGAGSWECPSGRVDQGEGIEEALIREAWEETHVEVVPQFMIGTSHFFRGEEKPENELVSVIYSCNIDDPSAVKLSDEHSEGRWMTQAEVAEFLPPGHWLQWVIERAELMRAGVDKDLQKQFLVEGFRVGGRLI